MHNLYRPLLAVLLLLSSFSSIAAERSLLNQHIPQPEKVGEGSLTYLLWHVYDATLYASEGKWQPEQPHALSLTYQRSLEGKQIADRSIEEIRRQGINDELKMASWHRQLSQILPDVDEGTVLTGIYTEDKTTVFYRAGTKLGEIVDPDFGKHFFAIWLGENTSAPKLRKQLLALP
jgi:hypothetical protein